MKYLVSVDLGGSMIRANRSGRLETVAGREYESEHLAAGAVETKAENQREIYVRSSTALGFVRPRQR